MLHLFNPYNDLALALNSRSRFTPPRQAALIAEAGSLLPLWWAEPGDFVLADPALQDACDSLSRRYGLQGRIYGGEAVEGCSPWGWSHDARLRFLSAGAPSASVPSPEWVDRHRLLSHRRISAALSTSLVQVLDFPLPPTPIEATTLSELSQAIDNFDGCAMVKLPYSTSGRGIIDTQAIADLNSPHFLRQAEGMLRRQGSVMVERKLNRIADFAMLFSVAEGHTTFRGYSLFHTVGNAYKGNILIPDDDIRQRLTALGADENHLRSIEQAVPPILDTLIGSAHSGWLGVDMLLYDDGKVNPCVELNLRMTMGVVAHHLTRRFFDGKPLLFTVTPTNTLKCENKIIHHLIPANPHFTFAITENFS